MKKAIVLLLSVLLIGAVAFSANANIRSTVTSKVFVQADRQMQMQFYGASIPTTNPYVDIYLDNVGNATNVDFLVTAVASGNITTADLQPIYSNGANVTTSVTLTSGTPVTAFKSMYYRMRVYNPKPAIVNTATLNVLVIQK